MRPFSIRLFFIILGLGALHSCYNLQTAPTVSEPSAYFFYQKALESRIEGDLNKALQQVNQALRINNHISLFYVLKAQIFDSLDIVDSALYYYKKSLSYRSHSPEVLKRLAALHYRTGQLNQAISYYRKAFTEEPDSLHFLLNIGQLYLELGDFRKAENILDEYRTLLQRKGGSPSPAYYIALADLALSKGDSLTAARNYALSHCGACLSVQQARWAFETLLKAHNLEAYFELLSGLAQNPAVSEGQLFYYRGLYYRALGNHHEAIQQLERAYANGLRNQRLLTLLLDHYRTSGQKEKVLELEAELHKLNQADQHRPASSQN